MKKRFEIWLLRLVVYILQGRDVQRSPFISRFFNKRLWGMSEYIEAIIAWMEGDLDYDSEFDTFRDPKEPSDNPYDVNL